MASGIKYLNITSLMGGVNDSDPPLSLDDDVCTVAENVEFFQSTLGERRLGCVPVTLPAFGVGVNTAAFLARHLPTNTLGDAELWGAFSTTDFASTELWQRTKTAWTKITISDGWSVPYRSSMVSLHGKLFAGQDSTVDRLHVWDGTTYRRAGHAPPTGAPSAFDSGGAGTLSGVRYYRVRYSTLSGTTVLRRSEPSPVLTFTPGGASAAITITKPVTISENESHWELEASTDNANFYRIATTIVGTTTFIDSTPFVTGYAAGGILSETLTSYTTIPSGKFIATDGDRLLIAGSWENTTYASRLWWSPVFGSTGVGNDERLDMTVNPFIDLDGFEGGEITGLSRSVNGYIYVFKFGHVYKVTRTGIRSNAYDAICLTKDRGAFPGSLVEAVDEAGHPSQYFLDPKVGPMRIGNNGLEWCGRDILGTWSRINRDATIPAHGVFYQAKNQVHWWVAVDGSNIPNMKIILHTDQIKSDQYGARRGWVTVPSGDRIAAAYCSTVFSNNIDTSDNRNQTLVPFIGKTAWIVGVNTISNIIQQCDTGATDGFTNGDTDSYFYGRIQTKPYFPVGIMNRCGILASTIVARSMIGANNALYIQAIKDFGTDQILGQVLFTPSPAGEELIIKTLDSFVTSEMTTVQFNFGDLDTTVLPTATWFLHAFSVKVRGEQTA